MEYRYTDYRTAKSDLVARAAGGDLTPSPAEMNMTSHNVMLGVVYKF